MIYLVHSRQSLLVEKEIKRILKNHIDEINEFSYVSYDLTQTLLEDIIEDAKTLPFMVEHKAILVKNFDKTRGKMNQKAIWRYRALASDFYVFDHEYIFIFKKVK